MKILTAWLRTYIPNILTGDHQLAEDLTLRGIAVEGVHDLGADADGKPNGHLFEMDITTNRVDAMNHYGIAREAATIYNLPLVPLSGSSASPQKSSSQPEERTAPGIPPEAPGTARHAFPVRIEAPNLCGRFTAQVLRNVTIAPSTGEVAEYFQLLGQKLISNAVDASNFTLLGMGHPTHAFDLDKIDGGIVVRLARKGERLKLLDGTDRTLEADDLVVADRAKPLALAGVMGGWDSMITQETRNVLVEAAWFDPASIRRSARRHGLHTDASHRFERGADFNAAPVANRLVSQLILQHGGHADGELIDVLTPAIAAKTANRPPVQLSVQQVQRHLGVTLEDTPARSALSPGLIHQYLTALGCTLSPAPNESFNVQLPSWRLDLEREIDLIEEVARVFGYNRFANTLPAPGVVLAHPLAAKEAAIRGRLLALGFSESISSTFASRQDADLFPQFDSAMRAASEAESPATAFARHNEEARPLSAGTFTPVALENPLSDEASLLRPSLIPGMLAMLTHNLNRDVKEVRLFEQGQIFSAMSRPDSASVDAVSEVPQLSLGLTLSAPRATPLYPPQDAPFFELKGAIESLLSLFDIPQGSLTFVPEAPTWLQPGRSAAALLNHEPIAHFGEIAYVLRESRKLRQPLYLAQLDLAALYALQLKKITAHDLSRFPAVERDFSFTFPDTMPWHTIAAAIHALNIRELQSLAPTEIFRDLKGRSVPPAHYALLLKCVFQSSDRTLRDDELTAWWSSIIATLTRLGGVIRAPADTV